MTVADVMLRVEKGAAWLDVNAPGWHSRVVPSKLAMSSCTRCVLGQACGDYWKIVDLVDPKFASHVQNTAISPWALNHGFNLSTHEISSPSFVNGVFIDASEWGVLREAWITVILSRQFAEQQQAAAHPQPVSVTV